jgi:hypothetical protein
MRHRGFAGTAVMFFVFAVMFSVVFWKDVSMAAKIAFFATGVGCGASMVRAMRGGSKVEKP